MNNPNENIPKEQWENEILSSLEGMRRAEAPPFLFTRIQSRLRGAEANVRTSRNARVSAPMLAFGVAAFIVLCCVNVWVLVHLNAHAETYIAKYPTANVPPPQAASVLETVNFNLY